MDPSSERTFVVVNAQTPADVADAAALIRAYAAWLDLDLSFQDFARELATLPGRYGSEEGGCMLLARDAAGEALGVIAMRALDPGHARERELATATGSVASRAVPRGTCELKRLYTVPAARGRGVGTALVKAVLARAGGMGYRDVQLDTLPVMAAARGLYESLGFGECERYYETPIEGTVFLRLTLAEGEGAVV